ncbi:MAG TPA: NADH-quinone oxidoreductase subunit J [Acidobacteriaceae bacterium]|nr:NADH-quinone oxidoreductase subunit J [Acidobacteriaceae bacterium]
MTASFLILAILTLAGGVAAVTLRRLVHCALALAVSFAGLAALYLNLGAEFAGLAQLLVYVGAIAILIVFAILLTRGSETEDRAAFSPAGFAGAVLALAVFAVLAWAVVTSGAAHSAGLGSAPPSTMREIGFALMQRYVLPLEVIALMLTAAMIGAVIVAVRERASEAGTTAGALPRPEPGRELRTR